MRVPKFVETCAEPPRVGSLVPGTLFLTLPSRFGPYMVLRTAGLGFAAPHGKRAVVDFSCSEGPTMALFSDSTRSVVLGHMRLL